MTNDFKLDMTIMLGMHDAFRHDLDEVSRITGRTDGWDLFETLLRVHHTAEDDALWPVLREALVGRPDELAVVDEMETEHASLEPLLETIDAALARGDSAADERSELATKLHEHMKHEEEEALPLVDATLTEEQWMHFGETAQNMIGANGPRFFPWVLDGADAGRTQAVLGVLPPPVRQMYENEWRPAYAAQDWWAV